MLWLWLKAFHLIFAVTWFAALFYLPRLFVYHAMSEDQMSIDRFKVMERKLFFGIAMPGAVLTILFALGLLHVRGLEVYQGFWLMAKLVIIACLIVYQGVCWRYLKLFSLDRNQRSHRFFRWFNEIPVILLFMIVILATVKPI